MDALPKVSVIVLNWNGREHLGLCFDAVMATRYPEACLEVIMVDNGSVDDSVAFVRDRYARVKIIEAGSNLGFAGGNNLGAREALGEYVVFLNNDAHVTPDWLAELVRAVQSDTDVVCAGARLMNIDGDRVEFGGARMNFCGYGSQEGYASTNIKAYEGTYPVLFACGGACLIKRSVYLSCGGFDEDYFAYYEDADLGWRLWVLGYKVLYVGSSVVLHKHHGSGHHLPDASRRVLYERNALLSVMKNYDDANFSRVGLVALLLAVKRLYLASGMDSRTYRVGYPAPRSVPLPRVKRTPFWVRVLKEEGLASLFHRAHSFVFRKRAQTEPAYPPPHRQTLPGMMPGYEQVSRTALAHLVAINDVVDLLPRILEKRAFIQISRRRKDEEIFKLFGDPFGVNFSGSDYAATQQQMVRLFGVDEVFKKHSLEQDKKPKNQAEPSRGE